MYIIVKIYIVKGHVDSENEYITELFKKGFCFEKMHNLTKLAWALVKGTEAWNIFLWYLVGRHFLKEPTFQSLKGPAINNRG